MKINMVCLENGIVSCGFRHMAAYVKRLHPDTSIRYISTNGFRSMWGYIFGSTGDPAAPNETLVNEIAEGLASAEMNCFSSMTGYAALTRAVIKRVKELNPQSFIIWGGIHPIIHPEDAITAEVDAICTGEGEFAFEEFYHLYRDGKDYTTVKNFWFKSLSDRTTIIKNAFFPLMTQPQMDNLPFAHYWTDELIYELGKGFIPIRLSDYLDTYGLSYHTLWSIGCPFECTYCGNTAFINNDSSYRKLRYPSVDYIIGEVNRVRSIHPHVIDVCFHDDSFMAIPLKPLTEFAERWRSEVGIPFAVYGVIPNFVQEKKFEILTWGGMNRIRMGVQSGSKRILEFYKRPSPPDRVEKAVHIINKFKTYHIPPAYDIIVDNPVETRQDNIDTLELLYRMGRPYTLNIYSLRIIPNTVLEQQMKDAGVDVDGISANYSHTAPNFSNAMIYLATLWKPPRWLFDRLLKHVKATAEPQRQLPGLILVMRLIYLVKRGIDHMSKADFTLFGAQGGYILWKLGIIEFWRNTVLPKYELPANHHDPVPAPVVKTPAPALQGMPQSPVAAISAD